MKPTLFILFLVVASLYSSVGFGGGSSYSALLALFGVNYLIIPMISLACNVLVVSGNTVRYHRAGLIDWREIWPFFALSIPFAWLGGRIFLSQHFFTGALGIALLMSSILLFTKPQGQMRFQLGDNFALKLCIGALLGFISGLVGIGGGIFLAPILHLMRWGRPKAIAALCSVFILVNSLAGLLGQSLKWMQNDSLSMIVPYVPLAFAVFIGGYIGNRMGILAFSQLVVKRLTGALVFLVACRLLWQFFAVYL